MYNQTTIVIALELLYGVRTKWLLSLDKSSLIFVNRREQINNGTIIAVTKNTWDTFMIGLVTRNYWFLSLVTKSIRISTYYSCYIRDNDCS